MHVLVTADTIGGVWIYTRELVSSLVQRGIRVTLVSFGSLPTPDQSLWVEQLGVVDYRPTAFKLEWMPDSESDVEASSSYLLSIIDEEKPDLLHLSQYCYGGLPVGVPKLLVAHSDVVNWWWEVKGGKPPADRWTKWYRRVVSQGLAGSDVVVAPSQWMMNSLGRYNVDLLKTKVIYNGRTPTLFNPFVAKERYAVSVGRLWDDGKQVSLVTKSNPVIPVRIAGAEAPENEACNQSRKLDNAFGIAFEGQRTEAQLRQLFSRASMYLATSKYEPFGLAPLEAALSRCALVCNDISTFRELWGDSVVYFQKDDAASLGREIANLHRDPEMRLHYANRAYNHALKNFTTARMMDEYLSLYQSLGLEVAIAA